MKCNACPNNCNVDRTDGVGACRVTNTFKIAKYAPFFYEEPPVSGKNGSGAIFFCGCSLLCKFCQNYDLSRNLRGKEIKNQELKEIIEDLILLKVHNINLVNPSHYLDGLYELFNVYKPKIPIVYNTHGYEKISSLKKAETFTDIYLTDLKYYSPKRSLRYAEKDNYFEFASNAILEMVNQKALSLKNEIMQKGVIVRHLMLPQNSDETTYIIKWYADNVGDRAYLSLMSQYTPFGNIKALPELNRKLTSREAEKGYNTVLSLGLKNVFFQEKTSANQNFIPNWDF